MTLKQKTLRVFSLLSLVAISQVATAQVDFTPIFTQIKLEARADFDYYHNTVKGDTLQENPYGFHGRYFNFVIGGPIGEKFSYFFRQRIIASPGDVSLFDNTDFLYINYAPTSNWMFRFGKDALAVGGFEYDAPPINVLFSTNYWDNFYCFQPSVAAAYRSDDASQMLLFQVGNSPYVHYGAGLGFAISKGFFDTIPRALDEAATIDGATRNQIFWKIILPMSKPIIVYTVLTSFIGPWCDFILAKIIMGDKRDNYTVAIGLQKMVDKEYKQTYFKQFLSGSVLVAIPITILFLKMQNYYVEGVTAGGVKG